MVIIVEGLDGTGKTTLCNQLGEDLGCEIIHEGYPGESFGIRLYRLRRLIENIKSNKLIIYDRCTCIDDFVYSMLNEQKSELGDLRVEIDNVLKETTIINVTVDKDEQIRRLLHRGDEYITVNDLEDLRHSYTTFYNELSSDVINVELTNDNNDNVKKIVKAWLCRRGENI